jgi:hypothetical protein
MPDSENEPLNVESVLRADCAFEDARLRRDCFTAAHAYGHDFDDTLQKAKVLYAWCMETDEDADSAQAEQSTGEDSCERKH